MKLDSYIKELLIQNDNIIVKGFGAFEKVLESAIIDEKSGEIKPPHMTIKFDDSLKVDSGTLTKFIIQKESISEAEASKQIVESVSKWEADLKAGKLIDLQGIGIISQTSGGKKTFEPKILPGTFPDMYGLPVLSVEETMNTQQKTTKKEITKQNIPEKKVAEKKKTVQQKKPVRKVRQPIKKTTTKEEDEKSSKKLMLLGLIAIPVIVLIVLGALNPDFVKTKFNSYSEYVTNLLSGNDIDNQNDASELDSNLVSDANEMDSTKRLTEAVLENYTIINAETNQSIPAETETLSEFHKFEVIAGSFKNNRNAKKFRNQLNSKGFTAKILSRSNGLYRVSIGSYDNVDIVAKEIENIQELDANLNVWILSNK